MQKLLSLKVGEIEKPSEEESVRKDLIQKLKESLLKSMLPQEKDHLLLHIIKLLY